MRRPHEQRHLPFCALTERATDPSRSRSGANPRRSPREPQRLLQAGEPVLLIDRKKRRYLIDLE